MLSSLVTAFLPPHLSSKLSSNLTPLLVPLTETPKLQPFPTHPHRKLRVFLKVGHHVPCIRPCLCLAYAVQGSTRILLLPFLPRHCRMAECRAPTPRSPHTLFLPVQWSSGARLSVYSTGVGATPGLSGVTPQPRPELPTPWTSQEPPSQPRRVQHPCSAPSPDPAAHVSSTGSLCLLICAILEHCPDVFIYL